MTAQFDILEKFCVKLDFFRQRTLRLFMPVISSLVICRDKRIGWGGSLLILMSFSFTMISPLWLLAIGPIILGVPHIAADILYLVVRQGLHRQIKIVIFAGLPLIIVAIGGPMAWGLAGCLFIVCYTEASLQRKFLTAGIIGIFLVYSCLEARYASLIFAHAHNFIAVALWWFWRKQRSGISSLPLFVFILICCGIITGAFDPVFQSLLSLQNFPGNMNLSYYSQIFAPGLSGDNAIRLVLLFAFAQSVHYAVWLRFVPDEDHSKNTPRTFKETYHALTAELGRPFIWLAVIIALSIGIWAIKDLQLAREGYLRLAVFHGYIELYALTLLILKGKLISGAGGRR